MKLLIKFDDGVYSSNKDKIKEVYKLLGYKYLSGVPKGANQLICLWKNENDNRIIKGIFNGSGRACEFIVDSSDDNIKVFESFGKYFNARIESFSEGVGNNEQLLQQAEANVNKWFTINKQEKGEPDSFYAKRLSKMLDSKKEFIQKEYNKLKELL